MDFIDIKIAGIVRESIVDGPGLRFTVFTQGCPHHCEGCHNPNTHSPLGGQTTTIERIFSEYQKNPYLAGITLSGGEPIMQALPCLELARLVKDSGGDVLIFTGYTFEQLLIMMECNNDIRKLLDICDILVDGPFILSKRDRSLPVAGSKNQRVLNLPRSLSEKRAVEIEVATV